MTGLIGYGGVRTQGIAARLRPEVMKSLFETGQQFAIFSDIVKDARSFGLLRKMPGYFSLGCLDVKFSMGCIPSASFRPVETAADCPRITEGCVSLSPSVARGVDW